MILSSVDHLPTCRVPEGTHVLWNEETGETRCLDCGGILEDTEVDDIEVVDVGEESDGHET